MDSAKALCLAPSKRGLWPTRLADALKLSPSIRDFVALGLADPVGPSSPTRGHWLCHCTGISLPEVKEHPLCAGSAELSTDERSIGEPFIIVNR